MPNVTYTPYSMFAYMTVNGVLTTGFGNMIYILTQQKYNIYQYRH